MPDAFDGLHTLSVMDDVVTQGTWKFNDVNHYSLRGEYITSYNGSETPGPDFYICDAENPPTVEYDQCDLVNCESIVELVKLNVINKVGTPSIKEITDLFRDSSLPHEVVIDRDPFETDFSIWYLLVDLIQAITSFGLKWPSLKTVNSVDNLLTKAAKARELGIHTRAHRHKPAAELAADVHLSVRFGVLPTIADIGDSMSVFNSWMITYDRVKELLAKKFRKHEHFDFSKRKIFEDTEETVIISLPHIRSSITVVVKQTKKARWHGLALYSFTCPYFQGWLARLRQIIDFFGVLDPSALWDIVPFSFVVDWIFTTNSWLHSLKPHLFPAVATVVDYLETISCTTTVTYTATWGSPVYEPNGSTEPPFFLLAKQRIGLEKYKTYVRKRFIPNVRLSSGPGSALKKSFVSCARVAVSASLLAQRVPR